jgi:hypothetical protein
MLNGHEAEIVEAIMTHRGTELILDTFQGGKRAFT